MGGDRTTGPVRALLGGILHGRQDSNQPMNQSYSCGCVSPAEVRRNICGNVPMAEGSYTITQTAAQPHILGIVSSNGSSNGTVVAPKVITIRDNFDKTTLNTPVQLSDKISAKLQDGRIIATIELTNDQADSNQVTYSFQRDRNLPASAKDVPVNFKGIEQHHQYDKELKLDERTEDGKNFLDVEVMDNALKEVTIKIDGKEFRISREEIKKLRGGDSVPRVAPAASPSPSPSPSPSDANPRINSTLPQANVGNPSNPSKQSILVPSSTPSLPSLLSPPPSTGETKQSEQSKTVGAASDRIIVPSVEKLLEDAKEAPVSRGDPPVLPNPEPEATPQTPDPPSGDPEANPAPTTPEAPLVPTLEEETDATEMQPEIPQNAPFANFDTPVATHVAPTIPLDGSSFNIPSVADSLNQCLTLKRVSASAYRGAMIYTERFTVADRAGQIVEEAKKNGYYRGLLESFRQQYSTDLEALVLKNSATPDLAVKLLYGDRINEGLQAIAHQAYGPTDKKTLMAILKAFDANEMKALEQSWDQVHKTKYGSDFAKMIDAETSMKMDSLLANSQSQTFPGDEQVAESARDLHSFLRYSGPQDAGAIRSFQTALEIAAKAKQGGYFDRLAKDFNLDNPNDLSSQLIAAATDLKVPLRDVTLKIEDPKLVTGLEAILNAAKGVSDPKTLRSLIILYKDQLPAISELWNQRGYDKLYSGTQKGTSFDEMLEYELKGRYPTEIAKLKQYAIKQR